MILILVGRQGSGKNAVQSGLIKNYGYEKLVTCTTRERREGDAENEYRFMPEEEFMRHVRGNDFLEWDIYRDRKYGTLKSSLETGRKLVTVMTPEGAQAVKRAFPDAFIVHINPGMKTAVIRAVSRMKELDPGSLHAISGQAMLDYYLYNDVQADLTVGNTGVLEDTVKKIAGAHEKARSGSGFVPEETGTGLEGRNKAHKQEGDVSNV